MYDRILAGLPNRKGLIFSIKHTQIDFWRYNDFNPMIGRGQVEQIVEFQCAREYEGKGVLPNYVGPIHAEDMLNIGPTPEGLIPEPSVKRLAEVGEWMKTNGESIYGTSASPFRKLSFSKCTQKPGRLYLHVFDWPRDGKLLVPISNKVTKAYLLTGRKKLKVAATDAGAWVDVPKMALNPIATVVVVEIRGEP